MQGREGSAEESVLTQQGTRTDLKDGAEAGLTLAEELELEMIGTLDDSKEPEKSSAMMHRESRAAATSLQSHDAPSKLGLLDNGDGEGVQQDPSVDKHNQKSAPLSLHQREAASDDEDDGETNPG